MRSSPWAFKIYDAIISVGDKLLHFFEVCVGDVVPCRLGRGTSTGLRTSSSRISSVGVAVHLFAGSLEGSLYFGRSCIDTFDILCRVCFLELRQSSFDSSLLVSGELVTEFLQLLFRLEDEAISLIELRDTFAFLLVGFGVGSCFVLHALDLSVRETAGSFDTDLLLLTRSLIQSRDIEDTISVNIEGHFDLRSLARRRSNFELEATDALIILSERTFTLQDVDLYLRLIINRRREDLALLRWDGRVSIDEARNLNLIRKFSLAIAGSMTRSLSRQDAGNAT